MTSSKLQKQLSNKEHIKDKFKEDNALKAHSAVHAPSDNVSLCINIAYNEVLLVHFHQLELRTPLSLKEPLPDVEVTPQHGLQSQQSLPSKAQQTLLRQDGDCSHVGERASS